MIPGPDIIVSFFLLHGISALALKINPYTGKESPTDRGNLQAVVRIRLIIQNFNYKIKAIPKKNVQYRIKFPDHI
jgi:hypothetical protein